MPQTKARGTRYQPRFLYLTALALATVSGVINFGEPFMTPLRDTVCAALSGPSKIKWQTLPVARLEAVNQHKPLLYFVSVREDGDSLRLQTEIFNDSKIAELINSNYIPVKISMSRRDLVNVPPALKAFHEQYNLCHRATLIAVAPKLISANSSDLNSSANLMELGVEDTANLEDGNRYAYGNHYRGHSGYDSYDAGAHSATYTGFVSKQDVLNYLYSARLWHQLPPTTGKVAWQGVNTLQKPLTDKPRLIALVDDIGASSDSFRLDLFWPKKMTALINKNFEPILVEFKRGDEEHNLKYQYLKETNGITSLPALVVESKKLETPLVQFGNSGMTGAMDFLQSALKPEGEIDKNFARDRHGVRIMKKEKRW